MNQRRTTPTGLPEFMKDDLQAISKRSDQAKIHIPTRGQWKSGDIDTHYKPQYPHDHRWDYVIMRVDDRRLWFVEIHPGTSDGYSEVIKKLTWLKDMLNNEKSDLYVFSNLPGKEFYWLRSGKNKLLPHSTQARQLALQKDLKYCDKLILPSIQP